MRFICRPVSWSLASEALARGVYVMAVLNIMVIAPPLIVTEEEIDEGVRVIDEVLNIADAECT